MRTSAGAASRKASTAAVAAVNLSPCSMLLLASSTRTVVRSTSPAEMTLAVESTARPSTSTWTDDGSTVAPPGMPSTARTRETVPSTDSRWSMLTSSVGVAGSRAAQREQPAGDQRRGHPGGAWS